MGYRGRQWTGGAFQPPCQRQRSAAHAPIKALLNLKNSFGDGSAWNGPGVPCLGRGSAMSEGKLRNQAFRWRVGVSDCPASWTRCGSDVGREELLRRQSNVEEAHAWHRRECLDAVRRDGAKPDHAGQASDPAPEQRGTNHAEIG